MNKTRVMIDKYLLVVDGEKKSGYLGYYVKIYNYNNVHYRTKRAEEIATDEEICDFLDIDLEYYYETMIKFRGVFIDEELYFRKIRHAKKAFNWIEKNLESLLIMKKVIGH